MKIILLLLILSIGGTHAIQDYYLDTYCQSYSIPQIDLNYVGSIHLYLTSSYRYGNNMNCSVTLSTSPSSNLMFYFKSFDVGNVNYCQNDFLELHDGNSLSAPYANGFYGKQCGTYISQSVYTTSNNALTLWFHSDGSYSDSRGFDMVITSYHYGDCFGNEHQCYNGRCVDNYLTCNGYNPCGDFSDCNLNLTAFPIIGIVSGCTVFAIIITVVVIVCEKTPSLCEYVRNEQPVRTRCVGWIRVQPAPSRHVPGSTLLPGKRPLPTGKRPLPTGKWPQPAELQVDHGNDNLHVKMNCSAFLFGINILANYCRVTNKY